MGHSHLTSLIQYPSWDKLLKPKAGQWISLSVSIFLRLRSGGYAVAIVSLFCVVEKGGQIQVKLCVCGL